MKYVEEEMSRGEVESLLCTFFRELSMFLCTFTQYA